MWKFIALSLLSITVQDSIPPDTEKIDPETCPPEMDIVFLLDTSSGVQDMYKEHVKWTMVMIDALPVHKDAVRVATIQYSGASKIEFDLEKYYDKDDLIRHLNSIVFEPGVTRTGLALQTADDVLTNPEKGARRNASKVAVVFTDGLTIDDAASPATKLREKGVKIYVVSVGTYGFVPEMLAVSGNATNIHGPSDIERLKEQLAEDVENSRKCGESQTATKPLSTKTSPTTELSLTTDRTTVPPSTHPTLITEVHNTAYSSITSTSTQRPTTVQTASRKVNEVKQLSKKPTKRIRRIKKIIRKRKNRHGHGRTFTRKSHGKDGQKRYRKIKRIIRRRRPVSKTTQRTSTAVPTTQEVITTARTSTTPETTRKISTSTTTTARPSTTSQTTKNTVRMTTPFTTPATSLRATTRLITTPSPTTTTRKRPTTTRSTTTKNTRRPEKKTTKTASTISIQNKKPHRIFASKTHQKESKKCLLDILFVVDSSGSVGSIYEKQKEYLSSILEQIDPRNESHRVALIQFAGPQLQKMEWSFDSYKKNKAMMEAFHHIRHLTGTTFIGAALKMARTELEERRPRIPTLVVLVSDGFSQDNGKAVAAQIRSIPNVELYAISLAELNNIEYLQELTSSRQKVFVGEEVNVLRDTLIDRFNCVA